MKVIWPDGAAQNIPNNIPELVWGFVNFCAWYDSLPKEKQEEVKKDLQQHGRSDKATESRF